VPSIRKNRDFSSVYKTGRREANALFVSIVKPNGGAESRLGVSVSKKVGGAVVRNRIKRQVKENMRLMSPALLPGYDIVLAARPVLGTLPRSTAFGRIRDALQYLMKKQRLLQ
jgi:ribonuclease P protein component